MVGNHLTADALLWSALSVAMLLAGLALVLFTFGRFDYLGWKGEKFGILPGALPGEATAGQKATIKYGVIVALLFLARVMIGGALAHYRAEPGDFYGIDLARFLPSNILRTWHLQLAIFWIATAYVSGGFLLASSLGRNEPRGQSTGIHMLFVPSSSWWWAAWWGGCSAFTARSGTCGPGSATRVGNTWNWGASGRSSW